MSRRRDDGPRLKVVVADDEPLALQGLVELLATDPQLEVVGAYKSGAAALAGIREHAPDLIILDIRMPGLSGFEIVGALDSDPSPGIVFVTAYDRHAVEAFEANAIDYVLKPFTDARLFAAIERAKDRRRDALARVRWDAVRSLLDSPHSGGTGPAVPEEGTGVERLIIRGTGRSAVVSVSEIDWIEGADYYARLHYGGRSALIRETLASLERRLDASRFFRVSKSAIVSLSRVVEVRSEGKGDAVVVLRDGTRVALSRGRRGPFEKALESSAL